MYKEQKITNSRYKCTVIADTNVADTVTPSLCFNPNVVNSTVSNIYIYNIHIVNHYLCDKDLYEATSWMSVNCIIVD